MSELGMDTSLCGLNFTDVCLVSETALISFRKAFHSATFEKYMHKINKVGGYCVFLFMSIFVSANGSMLLEGRLETSHAFLYGCIYVHVIVSRTGKSIIIVGMFWMV